MPNPIVDSQHYFNRSTEGNWNLFTNHRQHVMDLILSHRYENARSLCVLGAGNCNDLDLDVLAKRFTEIHLVDIDREALYRAMGRRTFESSASIILHGGFDISGVMSLLAGWCQNGPSADQIKALLKQASKVPKLQLKKSFDVVISSAVLTQLIHTIVTALGADNPRLLEVIQAIRHTHIRFIIDLMTVGGAGILISDLVSSDKYEMVENVSEEEILALMHYLISQGNIYTSVNPTVLESILREDPHISSRVKEVALRRPWKWRIGAGRTFLVYGLTFRKAH